MLNIEGQHQIWEIKIQPGNNTKVATWFPATSSPPSCNVMQAHRSYSRGYHAYRQDYAAHSSSSILSWVLVGNR